MAKERIQIQHVSPENLDLTGKTVVFTGGTDGMGRDAAEKFAHMGAEVKLLGRNATKTADVAAEINAAVGKELATPHSLDLEKLSSVRNAAAEMLEVCPQIDLLINCAGANFGERRMTEDGIERSWAVNHLGPFAFTYLLLDRLKKSAPARIVQLTSATQSTGKIDMNDLTREHDWTTLNSYAQAKLAMIMTVQVLGKELAGTGVTINALNPGWIRTKLSTGTTIRGVEKIFAQVVSPVVAAPAFTGANRIITAATAQHYDHVSGAYIHEDYVRQPNKLTLDPELVDNVWDISIHQAGLSKI